MPREKPEPAFEIVSDPTSVVQRFDPLAYDWGTALEGEWIFRGLGDSNFELLPTAWRSPPPDAFLHIEQRNDALLAKIVETVRSRNGIRLDRQEAIARRCYVEMISIEEFLRIADSIGVAAPLHIGRDIEHSVLVASTGLESLGPDATTALAQHAGLPTRLLDWTTDPLRALLFAASDQRAIDKGSSEYMAVWAIRRSFIATERDENVLDDFEPDVRLFAPLSGENSYLRSQRGCFTFIDGGEKWFMRNGEWPTVAYALAKRATGHTEDVIRGFKFRKDTSRELLAHLWRRGVNPGTLRPTLESAAETARLKWMLERQY